MGKLILVANRLPVKVQDTKDGLAYEPSSGGLATGLSCIKEPADQLWIGWPGIAKPETGKQEQIRQDLQEYNMQPIFLDEEQIKHYYEGFSNETIWPLFHYFIEHTQYKQEFWRHYSAVNKAFAKAILQQYEEGDIIWVHDYHLMLLPAILREYLPNATIGFFLHIPFPSSEVFRLLPWRKELLDGVLGADLIGFHTSDYMRHFSSSVYQLIGVDQRLGKFYINDQRPVTVDAFPMGIDFDKFHKGVEQPAVQEQARTYQEKFSSQHLMLSVDRLDYSKGILQRLRAFDLMLSQNPGYLGKVALILTVVPSRELVDDYKELKEEIDELVGNINGKYGNLDWLPIHYFYRSMDFETLLSLYKIANIGLVTPFRDGMNLIAKEYMASKVDGQGVLILSEMAGAAAELSEAMIINPNDLDQMAGAMVDALEMPEQQQVSANRTMQRRLKRYDIQNWTSDFLKRLNTAKQDQRALLSKYLDQSARLELLTAYYNAPKRLIVLDLDGTLMPVRDNPLESKPDIHLINKLQQLTQDPANTVVITSGRDRDTLEQWFGQLAIDVVGEHGAWIRKNEERWINEQSRNQEWKADIYELLSQYAVKTPGSYIEEKEFSLVWNYRKADAWLSELRLRNLHEALYSAMSNLDLEIMEGNKVLEIKNAGVNKGRGVANWLDDNYDFILAIGDDGTDEETFRIMPEEAYTIKVGLGDISSAKYNFRYPSEVRDLLADFMNGEYHQQLTVAAKHSSD